MDWETVIGLEVHVQLATRAKLFSAAGTAFGAEPNTQANAIDLAMPGTLPVPNTQAIRYACLFGLAVNAEINRHSVFERKNYFYPDLPKGYQTTQLAEPIVGRGQVEIQLEGGHRRIVRTHHAHLEEDAGKSLHEDYHGMTGIDLNRAGTPLIEIVTEPDMRSAEEAVAMAKKLHSLVTALEICDGDMSQGSMRFDVNISVRPRGQEEFGTRTETKNLNSFRFMQDAIEQEVERQIEVLESGDEVVQETRLYNGETGESRSMRTKEESTDYRYFPCPDLLPVTLEQSDIDRLQAAMPELPEAKRQRFMADYGLSDYDAGVLSADRITADYFETVASQCKEPKLAANWVMGELAGQLNQAELRLQDSPVSAQQLAGLIKRIADDSISSKIAKQVFAAMWEGEGDADTIIAERGLEQVSDTGALEKMVDEVIANSPQQVENYRNADEKKRPKMLGYFVGQVMKASQGQANPQAVNDILLKKLGE